MGLRRRAEPQIHNLTHIKSRRIDSILAGCHHVVADLDFLESRDVPHLYETLVAGTPDGSKSS